MLLQTAFASRLFYGKGKHHENMYRRRRQTGRPVIKTILEANADIQVCGLGENGKDAIDLFHQYQPDVLLMDIRMSEMTGLEAAEQLLVEDSSRKILLLTTFSDDEYIIKALNLV